MFDTPRTVTAILIASALLVVTPAAAWADDVEEPATAPRLLTHPDGPGELVGRAALGLSIDIAPTQVVEGGPRRIPTFELDGRFGLPAIAIRSHRRP